MCVGWGSFLGWGAFGIGALGWLGFCSEATGCGEPAAGASVNAVLLCCAAAGRASNETIATTFLAKSLQMKAADIILLQKLHKLIQRRQLSPSVTRLLKIRGISCRGSDNTDEKLPEETI